MKRQGKSTVRSLNCVFLCTQQVTSDLEITSDFDPVEREHRLTKIRGGEGERTKKERRTKGARHGLSSGSLEIQTDVNQRVFLALWTECRSRV